VRAPVVRGAEGRPGAGRVNAGIFGLSLTRALPVTAA
jgi:hypothetical protein